MNIDNIGSGADAAAYERMLDEAECICDPDYRYGYDSRCRVHGYSAISE